MDIADYSPAPSARRFDAGTPPVPNIYGGIAGISLIEEAGIAAVEEHIAALSAQLVEGLESLGADVVTPGDPARRGPLVCVRSNDIGTLVSALAADGVVASSREDNLRLALHFYNTADDVESVLRSLGKNRHLLAEPRTLAAPVS
jgi:selenocysteine lyase/cysteine desulfurase